MDTTVIIRSIVLTFCLSLLVPTNAAAGGGHAHGPDGSHVSDAFQGGGSGNVVALTKEAERNIGIKTIKVRVKELAPQKTLYGRVITDPRRVSLVTAPFQGKVGKIYVLPGAYVRKDEELLRVQPIQIGSRSTVLRAPFGGFVTDVAAHSGGIFNPTDSLLTISDLDTVLFEGDLFDSTEVNSIRQSKHCSVHTKRHPGKHFPCRIETVDARFRGNPPVGHVHASISNPDTDLKPGMTGQIHIDIGPKVKRLTIPQSAVLGEFEKRFIFRKDHGRYVRTPIQIGELFGDEFEVVDGISAGAHIVIQGHYQLQFARSEEGAEHDNHSHSHDKEDHGHSHGKESHDKQHSQSHAKGHSHDHDHDQNKNTHSHKGHEHKH
jgi:biotin carboxyl carrier protein